MLFSSFLFIDYLSYNCIYLSNMSFRLPVYYSDTCSAFGGRLLNDTPSKIAVYSIGTSVSEKAEKQISEPWQGWML